VHTQYFETVTVEVNRSKVHISEEGGNLKIYIPKDQKDQELCFLQFLPTKLFNEVMMGKKTSNSTVASNPEAVRIIAALFMSSDEVVGDFLDDGGIITLPYADEFDSEAYDRETLAAAQTPEGRSSSSGSRLFSPTPESSYRTNYRAATPTYRQPSTYSLGSRPVTSNSNEPARFSANSGQVEYHRLLSNVITAAKSKMGKFPSVGAFNLNELLNALPIELDAQPVSYDLPFGTRSENQLAHDMKVGAAGELYVRSTLVEHVEFPLIHS
jgi:hypothetical protein